jgi:Flp pilus assembly pilin Flp
MNLIKRLCMEEDGQGLVEYSLIVLLVAVVFWMGVRNTEVGESLGNAWAKVMGCVTAPASCST